MAEAVRVAVRVRPFIHEYEKAKGVRNIIKMDKNTQQTIIVNPDTGAEKVYTFDYSYNSFVPADHPDHADQETVWQDLGVDVLDNAWKGFNVSLFAYGQTGAGKSHSMIGYPGAEGIVPRACRQIFERIANNMSSDTTFKVEASMLEIYNEKVRDLFNPTAGDAKGLKVRDHPKTGPYVQGLTKSAVGSYDEISKAMDAGTRARTVAATAMNATSSRAHTIFQVVVTQTTVDKDAGKAMDKVSTVSLIDLAGSERADRTGASGDRLKEGCAINQSLSALGNVISALAERATNAKKKGVLVPYRDSVLTHLLKNSLGGNAKTVMIAAISPSCVNYDETLSTLRYADRAKQIKNKAVVNEDPNQKLIRGLKEEIEELRRMLAQGTAPGAAGAARPGTAEVRRIKEEMSENERLLRESEMTWEERLKESQDHMVQRDAALAKLGMGVDQEKAHSTPHILNVNQDPLMSGVLMYFFEEGLTRAGRADAPQPQTIVLSGLSIQKEHCVVSRVGNELSMEACREAKVFVNGKRVAAEGTVKLMHGDRIVVGNNYVFICVIPGACTGGYGATEKEALLAKNSWDSAMLELNEAQMSSLTEGEREARERAEREARAMQEKVRALEAQMAQERRRAEEEARAATDAERERMVQEQRALEAKLQAQIDTTYRLQAAKDDERRKRAVLEGEILRTLPLVSEANAISDELNKGKDFGLQLVAATTASSSVASGSASANPARLEKQTDADAIASAMETTVWIRVSHGEDDIPNMWSLEKFVNRLYLMREMYEDFVDAGRDLAEVEEIYGEEYDPFFDPPEEQLIGKAYVMLAPLGFFINIDDTPPVIQFQGKTDGALHVSVTLDEKQVEALEQFDTDEETTLADIQGTELRVAVTVHAADGLPKKLSNQVAVSYKFYNEEAHRTPACETVSINPRFDHVTRFKIRVDEAFASYVQTQPLEFQVWGSPDPEIASMRKARYAAPPETKEEAEPDREPRRGSRRSVKFSNKGAIEENSDSNPVEDDGSGEVTRNEVDSHYLMMEQKLEDMQGQLQEAELKTQAAEHAKKDLEDKIQMLTNELTKRNDDIKELESKTKALEATQEFGNQSVGAASSSKACEIM
ncbi:Kinesin-related protein 1 [Hondaea fermentalgiana]|uniref:Kinesin-related protein 1 n=1 Tax=Hondaea fermentalgiana TaxID=2315210 RepID=A0A2R5G8E8_9STRA|nr:Kinesin-related protein 1 [Hondaea fermentalgiana]|eukprot:GBG27336.1 Kinesin-related protein 1 [Hondaea fermentalgiana]